MPLSLPRLPPQFLLQLHRTQHSPVMKTPEPPHSEEKERDRDRDPERGDRIGAKQKSSAPSSSKCSSPLLKIFKQRICLDCHRFYAAKDLSHVPCKFFKVGGCTAGSSCPFSHNLVEPGGQKETCAWFVKGTCKFGHKCALAHILPGQTMAMDRKNKKAAQLADRSEKPDRGAKGGRASARRDGNPSVSPNAANRNNLLGTGSTAPTRMLSPTATPSSRPPMMKATLSPSVPAPPLASFGDLDDLEGAGRLPTAPAQGKTGSQDNITTITVDVMASAGDITPDSDHPKPKSTSSPGPLPTSAPRSATTPTKPKFDFGPIGSPPTGSSLSSSRLNPNGAPGTSPHHVNGVSGSPGANYIPSSPFSAPGAHSGVLSGGSYTNTGGIASSLNALSMMNSRRWGGAGRDEIAGSLGGMAPRMNGSHNYDLTDDNAVEDGELEGFLPNSLTDLLTPEERTRRMSRSNSGQPPSAIALDVAGLRGSDRELSNNAALGSEALGHRYSRSVPAPSLLGDIKSIWADNSAIPASPPAHRATPSSSFTTRFDPLSTTQGTAEDMALSMSLGSTGGGMMSLSPSNASAAFLPGLHSHYLNAKVKQAQQAQQLGLGIGGLGRGGARNPSAPIYSGTLNTPSAFSNNSPSLLSSGGGGGLSPNPSTNLHTHVNPHTNATHTYRATPSPFDLTQQQHHHDLYPQASRPIPSHIPSAGNGGAVNSGPESGGGVIDNDPHRGTHLLSPSSRALQSHAPGQSLPQGLAAGYSRIHALPPPPVLGSPASGGGVFGTPPGVRAEAGEAGTTPTTATATATVVGKGAMPMGGVPTSGPYGGWKAPSSPPANAAGGLDTLFSRLSYSAAAVSRTGGGGGNTAGVGVGATVGAGAATGAGGVGGVGMAMSPPGLTRNVSGGRYAQPLSPLSGPVVTSNDDDDLFSMDG